MCLSRVSSLRAAAVLEDCADRLDIMGYVLTVQMRKKSSLKVTQEKARLIKLKKDCKLISEQVAKLHLELKEKQSFSCLQQIVEEEDQEESPEKLRDTKKDLMRLKEFHQKQEEEYHHKLQKMEELQSHAAKLKLQLNDLLIENKSRSAEKMIELKLQQLQIETGKAEKQLEDQIQFLQKELKEEERTHDVAMEFLQNDHKAAEEDWPDSREGFGPLLSDLFSRTTSQRRQQELEQHKFNTQQLLKEKKEQLNSVRCKITLDLDRLMEMKRKYRIMELVVIEDKEEQEILQQQQLEVRAATKVQAWWRGCMVRRGLGSFRNANEDKKDKKKKDGKKKKKKK